MSPKLLPSFVTAHYSFLFKTLTVVLGCIAFCWGVIEFPRFWQESSVEHIANRIIGGDPFKVEILARQLVVVDGIEKKVYCRPAALRSETIIQLRMMELAISANDREHFDERSRSLSNRIHNSLLCSPADSFLWLALYWLENIQNGVSAHSLKNLWMSYQSGPNEGWVAIKRNRLALAEYDKLPARIAEEATNEFIGLVESGFYEQTGDLFIGQSSRVRELLLIRLKNVDERHRRAFVRALAAKGEAVEIPGIEHQGLRKP
jgi:hypothetical protein